MDMELEVLAGGLKVNAFVELPVPKPVKVDVPVFEGYK
jgi:hypothetical protein